MARKPVKIKKKAQPKLTNQQIEFFIFGTNFLDCLKPAFKNEQHMRDMWAKYGEHILLTYRDFQREPEDTFRMLSYESGTRPWAWWKYDAPEMRSILTGEVVPFSNKVYFGEWQQISSATPDLKWESQFVFLKRHSLLFEGEERDYLRNLQREEDERFKRRIIESEEE